MSCPLRIFGTLLFSFSFYVTLHRVDCCGACGGDCGPDCCGAENHRGGLRDVPHERRRLARGRAAPGIAILSRILLLLLALGNPNQRMEGRRFVGVELFCHFIVACGDFFLIPWRGQGSFRSRSGYERNDGCFGERMIAKLQMTELFSRGKCSDPPPCQMKLIAHFVRQHPNEAKSWFLIPFPPLLSHNHRNLNVFVPFLTHKHWQYILIFDFISCHCLAGGRLSFPFWPPIIFFGFLD